MGVPPSTEQALPKRIEGLNIENALKLIGGRENVYRKFLGSFKQSYASGQYNISTHYRSGDLKKTKDMCHSLKGVCASMGADSLAQLASEIELSLAENELDRVGERIADLETNLAKIAKTVAELVSH